MKPGQPRLGAQLWLERDADAKRVDFLVRQAADTGLDLLRIFLMWPWMEPTAGEWVFEPFDAAFEAAQRHGLGIKATLTANSGPWHIGTPSLLHSTSLTLDSGQRPAMRRYVETCVDRYRGEAALRQWIIWNEPLNYVVRPNTVNVARSDEQRTAWAQLLSDRYENLSVLNRRWRTGYTSFEEIPFPEDLAHVAQRGNVWESYAPWLDDYRLRVRVLHHELAWIADIVRSRDPHTPLCFNPPDTLSNHATVGYDLTDLAGIPDLLGATFHAPWQLTFAPPEAHVPLMIAGTSQLAHAAAGTRVEVTEFQLGNTYYAGRKPLGLDQSHICSAFLAPLLAGAESVTGWTLNTRAQDFEVGDWGLLDDADQIGYRAAGVRRVRDVLSAMDERLGAWTPVPPQALVLASEASQAVQLVTGFPMPPLPGREDDDAIHGSALLTTELLGLGIPSAMMPVASLIAGDRPDATLLVVSHMTAWDEAFAHELLRRVRDGAHLVIDGTSGHKDLDAALHRPWPGILSDPLGFRATGLRTDTDGYPVTSFGAPVGRFPLVIAEYEFADPAWVAVDHLRLTGRAAAPCVWTRRYGMGAVTLVAGPLGPALVHDEGSRPLARQLLSDAAGSGTRIRPLSEHTIALTVRGQRADAVGVLAPAVPARRGQPVRLRLPAGEYVDLWSGAPVHTLPGGEVTLPAPDGIAVIAGADLAATGHRG
jgi:beta-galactosidase